MLPRTCYTSLETRVLEFCYNLLFGFEQAVAYLFLAKAKMYK
jgi:hypothetical protein